MTVIDHLYLPASPERLIFPFSHFNMAQTVAFRDLYETDKNVVITAPTGAGKTVMFELALLRMLASESSGKVSCSWWKKDCLRHLIS